MKVKELISIFLHLRKQDGCIIITKLHYGAEARRFGNMNNEDVDKYTRGFNNGN